MTTSPDQESSGVLRAPSDGDDSPPAVDDPTEVTPAWMTDVLRGAGADVEVTGLRFEPIGTGQTGRSYRFHLDVRPTDAATAPATVVVKMAAGPPEIRAKVKSAFRTEVGFYRGFAPSALIRVPRCWAAAISDDHLRCTLVLEDAHPARPGRQVDGCTLAQADLAVRNLAGLHAAFWNDPGLTPDDAPPWLRRTDAARLGILGPMLLRDTAVFLDRYRADLSPEDADTLRRAAGALASWERHVSARHTLIHGDYRLDNLLFSGDAAVLTVDWQTLEVGFPARDLAYFLATALNPPVRRSHERSLVAAYHDQLLRHGVTDYPADLCFEDYRRGMLQGPLITVIGCVSAGGERSADSDRMFLSMITHACAAIRDLGTLDLLT